MTFTGEERFRASLTDPDVTPDDVEEFRREIMPRGQVHVVDNKEATLLRLPDIEVYERFLLGGEGTRTLDSLVAHRPSGTVLLTQAGCRDEEDCTCNREEQSMVLRWSGTPSARPRSPPRARVPLLKQHRPEALAGVTSGSRAKTPPDSL